MATIREELVLADRFSATFSQYISAAQKAGGYTKDVANAAKQANAEAKMLAGAYNAAAAQSKMVEAEQKKLAASFRASEAEQRKMAAASLAEAAASRAAAAASRARAADINAIAAAEKLEASRAKAASQEQDRLNRSMRSGSSAADGLTRKIMGLAAAYLSLQSAKKLIDLSDTWTQTTARLDRMNDGRQTTPEVQDMIFSAAQRSRGDYQDTADMTAKLGTLAPDAFDSTAEVVAFAEQINKQFALAGTSAQGAQAAMLQLTQAMSSGVLRGEELNSVLEQAPTIAQSIAKYMGVTIGEMRELASEGKITANVVKAAVFSAAKETNAAFEAVPLTFSQAMTMVKNEGLNALRPVLEELNAFLNSDIGRDALNGFISAIRMGGELLLWLVEKAEDAATYIHDNWDTVSDALIVGAAAVAAVMAASAISTAVSWAIANWQLLLVVATIAMVIYMAREMGYTWEEIGGVIGGLLGAWATALYNNVSYSQNLIAAFAEFFANVFDNPVAAVANLFADLFDLIMRTVQNAASAIDMLLGTNISAGIANLRSTVQGFVEKTFGENEIKVKRMDMREYKYGWDSGMEKGRAVGSFMDNFHAEDFLSKAGERFAPDYDGLIDKMGGAYDNLAGKLGGIGEDTKAIRNSVSLSEEDVKLLVDMATREYVNNINLTAQTPIINVSGQNTGDTELDKQYLADALRDILIEQAASHTDLAYT